MQRTQLCVTAATFLSLQSPFQTDCSAWRVQEMLQFIYLHLYSLKYFLHFYFSFSTIYSEGKTFV